MSIEQSRLFRYRWFLLLAGSVALVVCALGRLLGDRAVMLPYLVAFVFWWSLSIGSLALAMLYYLAGGRWGEVLRPFALAGIATSPLMLVLSVPLAFQLPELYPWIHSEFWAAHPRQAFKADYLNRDFFLIRGAIYFAIWLILGCLVSRWSRPDVGRLDPRALRLRRLSAGGLVVLTLTASAAAVDWLMSLEPTWYSTMFPGLIALGTLVVAYLLIVGIVGLMADRQPLTTVTGGGVFIDLGNLMLTFIMLWTYLFFSQFLIIWSGNLPDEARWFLKRMTGGWQFVILTVMLLHFLTPFLLLLSRDFKQDRRSLATVAFGVLVVHYAYLWWTIRPSHYPAQLSIHWADIIAPIGIGGLWLFVFATFLQNRLPTALQHLAAAREAEKHEEETSHGQ